VVNAVSGDTQGSVHSDRLRMPDDYQAWSKCALRVDAARFARYRQAVIKDLTSAGRPWNDHTGSAGSGENGETHEERTAFRPVKVTSQHVLAQHVLAPQHVLALSRAAVAHS
jgi:hypothetical protein